MSVGAHGPCPLAYDSYECMYMLLSLKRAFLGLVCWGATTTPVGVGVATTCSASNEQIIEWTAMHD